MKPEERIKLMGVELPPVAPPIANFVNYRIVSNLLYVSGQGPRLSDGTLFQGKLGGDVDVTQGYMHARQVGLNLLAVAKAAVGELSRITAVIKLLGMVNAVPEFTDHPKVINGCSDLMVEVFGRDVGSHARSAVGFSSLPGNISVEIEAIFEID